MEPASTTSTVLGVKYATLIAGIAGGVVSLSFLKDLTRWQSGMAVLTGALTAGYLTPVITRQLHAWVDTGLAAENAVGFLLGLTAMNIVPGLIKISEFFKQHPLKFFKRFDKKNKSIEE